MAQDFYFAWVADGNTTFGVEHQVNDEAVVGFQLDHAESEAAGIRVQLRNPRVGLLNAGRKQWAWISWRKPDNTVIPLFHGRLVAMPTDIVQDVVSLEFVAKPANYEEQKAALAETLKVVPYWDKLFINDKQLDEPDAVLAARPALFHIGRTDKLVTISDILMGEAGSVVLGPTDVVRDTMRVTYGKPVPKVHMTATAEWTQAASGVVDFKKPVTDKFVAAGSPAGLVSSYTGQGLESTWPVYGGTIGGGWSVDLSAPGLVNTDIKKSSVLIVTIDPKNSAPDFTIEDWWADSVEGYDYWYNLAYEFWLADVATRPLIEAHFARWDFRPTLFFRYEASRKRKETMDFTVVADMQKLVADGEGDAEIVELKAASTIVADPDPVTGIIPIGTPRARAYWSSDRGQDSIAYLLNICRSYILIAARAVDITIQIPFLTAVGLSCRHDIVLSLDELPGGVAGGKVTSYSMHLSDGQLTASVTFSAVVGEGNSLVPPDAGEASYVDEAYVEDTYQVFYGESLQPVPGIIEYTRPTYEPHDDGIDFDGMFARDLVLDLQATALLTFAVPGVVGNNIIIGLRVYTLKAVPSAANEVKIGADSDETARNLTAAINRDEAQEGTTFGTGTLAHADVLATTQDGIVRATARVGGLAGNAIAVSSVGAGISWDHPTLLGGSAGLLVQNGPAAQAALLLAEPHPGNTQMAIDRLNANFTEVDLALKPVTGGPFETDLTLVVSNLMVPKTIDLSAAAL